MTTTILQVASGEPWLQEKDASTEETNVKMPEDSDLLQKIVGMQISIHTRNTGVPTEKKVESKSIDLSVGERVAAEDPPAEDCKAQNPETSRLKSVLRRNSEFVTDKPHSCKHVNFAVDLDDRVARTRSARRSKAWSILPVQVCSSPSSTTVNVCELVMFHVRASRQGTHAAQSPGNTTRSSRNQMVARYPYSATAASLFQ